MTYIFVALAQLHTDRLTTGERAWLAALLPIPSDVEQVIQTKPLPEL